VRAKHYQFDRPLIRIQNLWSYLFLWLFSYLLLN